jgi:GNAT superfamily N-acetyltransferase
VDADGAIGWRPITVQDVPEWVRLLTTIEESAGTQEFAGEDDLLDDLRDPNVDPERGTIAAFRQGSMIAWSGLRASPGTGGRHEMHLLGGVHPGYRGQGLGTRLLAWAEQAAPVLHADRHAGGQLALAGHCLAGQDDAVALFAEAGYLHGQPAGVLMAFE